ncbi:chromosome-associated kinesin KIF4-like [Apostichopus japonicus]|uniref:chromosome-associated kinesin KIF4-like n=1 Tax=Stichopus japonicus TaxID=307972 RepID=UPI003AB74978
MAGENSDLPVRVAVRCRPLIMKEISEGCQQCIEFVPGEPQVILGKDKAFTYDFAFSPTDPQQKLFDDVVFGLVDGIFKGYNATVLAYGQTGSGKTYSMGSGYDLTDTEKMGVIPRVIKSLFQGIEERMESADFILKCSFLELHNDDILDLLQEIKDPLNVREDTNGEIKIVGLSEVTVSRGDEMIALLEKGSAGRTTGSTAMNMTSSRSHAVFTIHIEQCSKGDSGTSCQAKFHLVDLAGSERAKRTQAKGDRFKEGVNINRGLLALGNVISALGDDNGRKSHIPYRDSKLTRLLQDSLGGNSQTVMIACVSPADTNMEETLNTLRYADRARKIKNKPVVNRDPQAAEMSRLRQQVQQLQYQLMSNGGTLPPAISGGLKPQDSEGMKKILDRNKKLERENQKLSEELHASLDQTTQMCEKAILAEMHKDKLKQKLDELRAKTDLSISLFNTSVVEGGHQDSQPQQLNVLQDLKKQIEELKSEPMETEDAAALYDMHLDEAETSDTPASEGPEGKESPSHTGQPSDANSPNLTKQALRQAQLGRELQELNKALAKKQELASTMVQSEEKMEIMKIQYEDSIKGLETQINALQREKDTLSIALQTNKSQTATSKISEQRRKRLKELEDEMSKLKKKVQEQSKIIKLKAKSDETVNKLNVDIKGMKQARVRLMRQIKEDAEKTRQWKMAKDKEVLQLKAKDRKRQCDVSKMERKYEKQQNVLRRKMEEAAAANKRLRDAMERHKAHTSKKPQHQGHHLEGMGKRVKTLLERELDVLVSVNEAKRHLASLLEDRKTITGELNELKEKKHVEPPNKRRATPEKVITSIDPSIQQRMDALEQELDMRNLQIKDLQQKIMDANQDGDSRKIWKNISSMAEAKCGLQWLMEQAVLARVDAGQRSSDLLEARQSLSEAHRETEDLQTNLEDTIREGDQRVVELQRGHEEKILYLLHQLSQSKQAFKDGSKVSSEELPDTKAGDDELKQRLHFQEEQITQLQSIHDQLQDLQEENSELKKKLTVSLVQGSRMSLLPSITSPENTPEPVRPKPPKKTRKGASERYTIEEIWDSDTEDDDADDDSDWVATPQVSHPKREIKQGKTCGCKTSCNTKRCVCRRLDKECGHGCACGDVVCQNRGVKSLDSSNPEDTSLTNSTLSNNSSSNTLNQTIVIDSSTDNVSPGLKDFQLPKPKSVLSVSTAQNVVAKKEDASLTKPSFTNLTNQGIVKRKRKLLSTSRASFFKPLN